MLLAAVLVIAPACAAAQEPPELARGEARLAAGDWSGALAILRRALPAAENDARLQSALARAYSELGEDAPEGSAAREADYRRALDAANRELELAPQSAQAHLDVAITTGKIATVSGAKTKLKLAPAVAEHARTALKLDPKMWQAHHVLGQWNLEIATLGGFKKFGASLIGHVPDASVEDAIVHFETARQLAPGSVRNALGLGRAYAEADRLEDARAELERGLALPPQEPRDPAIHREIRAELGELES